jgi:Amt family ammonium transporter
MAAGFAMLESGMVTSKSVSVICAKNIVFMQLLELCFG